MNKYIVLFVVVLFTACQGNSDKRADETLPTENLQAKNLLQGIWLESETSTPVMRIIGDTIYYPGLENIPIHFKINQDTFSTYGSELNHYQIEQ